MFQRSKQTLILILAICFVFSVCAIAFGAQKDDKKSSNVTVTGCLKQGDESDEFSLTGDDGKLYGLRSSSVKLSDHVGHKVTVSGKLKSEKEKDEDEAKESKENGNKEAGDIQVKTLKMVSNSCQ